MLSGTGSLPTVLLCLPAGPPVCHLVLLCSRQDACFALLSPVIAHWPQYPWPGVSPSAITGALLVCSYYRANSTAGLGDCCNARAMTVFHRTLLAVSLVAITCLWAAVLPTTLGSADVKQLHAMR